MTRGDRKNIQFLKKIISLVAAKEMGSKIIMIIMNQIRELERDNEIHCFGIDDNGERKEVASIGISEDSQDYENHSPDCGTKYRGCAPDCPKDLREQLEGEQKQLYLYEICNPNLQAVSYGRVYVIEENDTEAIELGVKQINEQSCISKTDKKDVIITKAKVEKGFVSILSTDGLELSEDPYRIVDPPPVPPVKPPKKEEESLKTWAVKSLPNGSLKEYIIAKTAAEVLKIFQFTCGDIKLEIYCAEIGKKYLYDGKQLIDISSMES